MKTNAEHWQQFLLQNTPESYRKWFEEERKYLAKYISNDARVLEVGCGDGRSIFDIIDITTNVTGIDHDDVAINDAKEHFKDYPQVKILKADAKKLPFEDNNFDFVMCMTTFANFGEDKFVILEEMKRVLTDEGSIIISVFSEDAFDERMKVYTAAKSKIKEIRGGTVVFEDEMGDNISEQFTKTELLTIFKKVDLEVVDITKVNMAYLCKLRK